MKTKKAATVNWNYKSTSDVAKVDAWEIQDGKEIEYYKKTNGIIIMYNCLDAYELESILTHIESSIPSSKSVLIVANFSDLDEYNTIDAQIERVRNASDQRETPIYFCKSSMATGRGLSMIYKFINIPYLRIKKIQLEESLKNTIQDLSIAEDEMILIEKNQNGKSVNQSESTISNGSSTNKSEDKKKKDENELVMQSDDEISLDSNDGQLFDKTVKIKNDDVIMTSNSGTKCDWWSDFKLRR